MAKIKHIFFDLDHTLWDFDANAKICLKEIHDEKLKNTVDFNCFFSSFLRINKMFWDMFDNNQITHDELREIRFKTVLKELNVEVSNEQSLEINGLFLESLPKKHLLMKNAELLLTHLKDGFNLHILSNGFSKIQILKLENSGILGYFDEIITQDVANAKKPQKEIFEYAIKKTKADKQESVMIGDNLYADIEGANNFGIKSVWYNQNKVLCADENQHQIQDLIELKDLCRHWK